MRISEKDLEAIKRLPLVDYTVSGSGWFGSREPIMDRPEKVVGGLVYHRAHKDHYWIAVCDGEQVESDDQEAVLALLNNIRNLLHAYDVASHPPLDGSVHGVASVEGAEAPNRAVEALRGLVGAVDDFHEFGDKDIVMRRMVKAIRAAKEVLGD